MHTKNSIKSSEHINFAHNIELLSLKKNMFREIDKRGLSIITIIRNIF